MDDKTLFDERLHKLGLDAPSVELEVDATITPTTLAKATTGSVDLRAEDLPKITLDARRDLESGPDVGPRADLALVATIGEGGMGRVHLARQRSLDRDVAVKTLRPGAPAAIGRALLREARLTGTLEHPGVIPIHALGVDEERRPLLVMKRVAGVDFATLLMDDAHPAWRDGSGSPTPLLRALEILIQVCLTVEFAHSRGVIHRDIKPENVMVGSFGEVYLLDWGVAASGEDDELDVLVGTPVFMPPEMALGRKVDPRTDVYLLGSLLHGILTKQPRHKGNTVADVLRAAMLSRPYEYGPEVPEQLAKLCNAATSRDPTERPQSAAAFRAELVDFMRHRAARALSDAAQQRLEALEHLLEHAKEGKPPEDLAGAYRLAAEARFGFGQAIREHDANDAAHEGLRRVLIRSIELELQQGHGETAEIFLRDLEDAPTELRERVAAQRAREAEQARERERLEKIQHDVDPSQARSRRTLLLIGFAIAFAVFWIFVSRRDAVGPSPQRITGLSAISLVLLFIITFAIRRRVLTNAFNRKMVWFVGIAMASGFVNRVLGLVSGTPVATTLAIDLMSFAGIAAAAAVTLTRGLWLTCAIMLGGVVLMRLAPDHGVAPFVATVTVAIAASAWALARAKRD